MRSDGASGKPQPWRGMQVPGVGLQALAKRYCFARRRSYKFRFQPHLKVGDIQIDHFKTTLHILNTLQTYKYIHFKTTFICPLRSIAGVPSGRALPGFPLTAHHLCAFLL